MPITALTACSNQCDHESNELITVLAQNKKHLDRTGIYKCSKCGKKFYQTIQPEDINMPIVNINGDLNSVGDDKKWMTIQYLSIDKQQDFNADIEIKLQGRTSRGFPKKNYNITLYKTGTQDKKKIEFKNWPKMSKFTLKGEWTDCRHIRNLGLSQLWGQIIHTQQNLGEDILSGTVNGGATDGFPILLYNNNSFFGLYEITIPKGEHLTNMEEDDGSETIKHALLCAEGRTPSTEFLEAISKNETLEEQGWDLKHNSIEEKDDWVIESFNSLISFVQNSSDDEFKSNISSYIDFSITLQYMCFLQMFFLGDNVEKNINWATYDGTIWIPLCWDLDTSFGYDYLGNRDRLPFNHSINFGTNRLFDRIFTLFNNEYKEKLTEMRQTIFKPSNIMNTLFQFYLSINPKCFEPDFTKYTKMPEQGEDFLYHLNTYITNRWNWLEEQ